MLVAGRRWFSVDGRTVRPVVPKRNPRRSDRCRYRSLPRPTRRMPDDERDPRDLLAKPAMLGAWLDGASQSYLRHCWLRSRSFRARRWRRFRACSVKGRAGRSSCASVSAPRRRLRSTSARSVSWVPADPLVPPEPTVRLVIPAHRVSLERRVRRAQQGRRVLQTDRRDRPGPADRQELSGRWACRELSERPVHKAESDRWV